MLIIEDTAILPVTKVYPELQFQENQGGTMVGSGP